MTLPLRTSTLVIVMLVIVFTVTAALLIWRYLPLSLDKQARVTVPLTPYRIGIVTDIQTARHKSAGGSLDPKLTILPLEEFINHTNTVFRPEIVVHDGDLIEGTGRRGEASIEDWRTINAYLNKITVPHLHVIGNHERRGLSDEEWKTLTGNTSTYYTYDRDNLRIMVLDYNDVGIADGSSGIKTDAPGQPKDSPRYLMTETQLQWIEQTLQTSSGKQIIVFMHVPINQELIDGGYHTQVLPLAQRERLHALFAEHHVQAVISGHVEALFYQEKDGVRYYTLPGFFRSENKRTPTWYGTYYDGVSADTFSLTMHYKKNIDGPYQTIIIPSPEFDAWNGSNLQKAAREPTLKLPD